MKYKLLYSLIALLVLLCFSACTTSMQDKPDEQTEAVHNDSAQPPLQVAPVPVIENYWHLACKNTNAVLYKNSPLRNLEFELVSAFLFDPDELSVKLESSGSNVSYRVSCDRNVQIEEEVFPFYLYQCYQGLDWKRMAELDGKMANSNSKDVKIAQELVKLQKMYLKEYQSALDQGKLPQLYRYVVGIGFDIDKLSSVERITAITLTLRGETKRYALDNLILDAEKEFEFENDGIAITFAISDAPIDISANGKLDLTEFDLQSQEPFTLTGLSFFEEDSAVITDYSVIIKQSDDAQVEMKWDGKKPIQVLEGESVFIHAICEDPQLAGVMEAVNSKYISVQYLSADGRECTEVVQCIYRMRQGLYDLYAVSDGVDVLSFYQDYYSYDSSLITVE